jgi:hypothetical protein
MQALYYQKIKPQRMVATNYLTEQEIYQHRNS